MKQENKSLKFGILPTIKMAEVMSGKQRVAKISAGSMFNRLPKKRGIMLPIRSINALLKPISMATVL
jgi:hypothetical protein